MKEIFVCQRCQASFFTREASCHPLYSILVEASSIRRDKDGCVIDCAEASGTQAFRAAKVAL